MISAKLYPAEIANLGRVKKTERPDGALEPLLKMSRRRCRVSRPTPLPCPVWTQTCFDAIVPPLVSFSAADVGADLVGLTYLYVFYSR